MKKDLHDRLSALAGPIVAAPTNAEANDAGTLPQRPGGNVTEVTELRPAGWDSIQAGATVLVHGGGEDGWYEATVVEAKTDDLFVLRWRDWPELPVLVRTRAHIALLNPTATAFALMLVGFTVDAMADPTAALRETPPFFAPEFHFSYSGPFAQQDEARPEYRSSREAEAYFDEVRKGAPERGIPGETIVVRDSFDARRFISAAWSEKGVLPFGGNYAEVDGVVVRTRTDLPGFAKVHFGAIKGGFVCNFAHPVIITTAHMAIGLSGVAPMQPWPDGDPMPGMSQDERNDFKMLYGLRNQAERGNAEERAEALRGLGQLMTTPGMRLDKPYPPDMAVPPAPKPRPEFEPTPKDVESILSGRPLCRDRPYIRNCIPGR